VTENLRLAIETFNRGDYLQAGEMFEHAARDIEPDFKELIGALNRVAAALHLRFERGGRQAAINLLSQALMTLDDLKPERAGIDTQKFSEEVSAFADDLRATPREPESTMRRKIRIFAERRRAPRIELVR